MQTKQRTRTKITNNEIDNFILTVGSTLVQRWIRTYDRIAFLPWGYLHIRQPLHNTIFTGFGNVNLNIANFSAQSLTVNTSLAGLMGIWHDIKIYFLELLIAPILLSVLYIKLFLILLSPRIPTKMKFAPRPYFARKLFTFKNLHKLHNKVADPGQDCYQKHDTNRF